MGRTYAYECAKCGFRAKVSGRADRGVFFTVQTILCRDCRQLYDAVVRCRVPAGQDGAGRLPSALGTPKLSGRQQAINCPPSFSALLNRLPYSGVKRFRWLEYKAQCPVSSLHRIHAWHDPDKCPRCGVYLEKTAIPYRIWD